MQGCVALFRHVMPGPYGPARARARTRACMRVGLIQIYLARCKRAAERREAPLQNRYAPSRSCLACLRSRARDRPRIYTKKRMWICCEMLNDSEPHHIHSTDTSPNRWFIHNERVFRYHYGHPIIFESFKRNRFVSMQLSYTWYLPCIPIQLNLACWSMT